MGAEFSLHRKQRAPCGQDASLMLGRPPKIDRVDSGNADPSSRRLFERP